MQYNRISKIRRCIRRKEGNCVELEYLEYFRKVAELQHMTQAAEELFISQSSLSLAIRRLEKEFGTQLFERKGRNIYLTPCGEILLRHVELALSHITKAREEISEYIKMQASSLTISSQSLYNFPGLMAAIISKYPNIVISYSPEDDPSLPMKLIKGVVDFSISPIRYNDSRIISEMISREPMCVIVSRNHPLADRKSVKLSELSNYAFAAPQTNTYMRTDFELKCKKAGFCPKVYYEGKFSADIYNAVATGKYISLRPISRILDIRQDIAEILIDDKDCYWTRYLSYRDNYKDHPVLAGTLEIIRNYFSKMSYSLPKIENLQAQLRSEPDCT